MEEREGVPPVTEPAPNQPEAVPVPAEGAAPYPPEDASDANPVLTEAPISEGGEHTAMPKDAAPVNTSANSLEYGPEATPEATPEYKMPDDDDEDE